METINSIYNNDKNITCYKYNFKNKISTKLKKINNNKKKILIVEGIFAHRLNLNYKQTLNIICQSNQAICYQRRLNRDVLERGRNINEVNSRFTNSWNLFYRNVKRYLRSNKLIYIDSSDKKDYKEIIENIKEFKYKN
tara:strand:- start:31 stop:444 length:414 start_codon:yes stop_codon:yes gene_type:complete